MPPSDTWKKVTYNLAEGTAFTNKSLHEIDVNNVFVVKFHTRILPHSVITAPSSLFMLYGDIEKKNQVENHVNSSHLG